jgi:hypothetical protein
MFGTRCAAASIGVPISSLTSVFGTVSTRVKGLLASVDWAVQMQND